MEPPERLSSERENQLASSAVPITHNTDDFDLSQPVMEERTGSIPGNIRIRIVRPEHPAFRHIRQGVLEANDVTYEPHGRLAKVTYQIKRVLIGSPIATVRAEHERLTKVKALAVLSSDAISSVAYATEAILINLVAAGSGYLWLTFPISMVIIALLAIVAISYRQTIPAYPNGGGSYIVAKENLGTTAGLVAAAALLIDYVLNVSVAKFLQGAWIVVLLIPLLILLFRAIHAHYQHFENERIVDIPLRLADIHHRVVVPIDRLDRASIQRLAYARSISAHVTAVHIVVDESETNVIREMWTRWQKQLPENEETNLLIIESPYRSLLPPLLGYIDTLHERHPGDTLTIILPEVVVAHWWEYILHNQTALRLKAALLFRSDIVVVSIPQHLRDRLKH